MSRHHFITCLDRRKRSAWNPEGVARAQYLYSKVLEKLGNNEGAKKHLSEARRVSDRFLQQYSQYLRTSPDDLVVFDQMVCLWGGRFSGKLDQNNRLDGQSTTPD